MKLENFNDLKIIGKNIILFGAGVVGELVFFQLIKDEYFKNKVFFYDNHKTGLQEKTKAEILSFAKLKETKDNSVILLTIESKVIRNEVKKQIKSDLGDVLVIDYPQIVDIIRNETDGGIPWVEVEETFDWEIHREGIKMLSEWICDDDSSVVDFGAGEAYLGTLLDSGIKYIPTDYKARTSEFLVYDFNKDSFPDISTDVSVLCQMLFYVDDLKQFLENVCKVTKKKIIVAIGVRKQKNFSKRLFTERDKDMIIEMLSESFELVEVKKYDVCETDIEEQVLLLFKRKEL